MMHTQDDTTAPRFCPRCKKTATSLTPLCPECGESIVEQGFCTVCERFLKLRAGDSCPKHEILLVSAPLGTTELGEAGFIDWVSIAAFTNPIAAEAPRIRLETEGIPTFVEGERMGGHGLYGVATGGVRLQVPSGLADEARILLSQTWTPATELDDDLDDAWDELAPEPGSKRRAVMKAIIVAILLLPLLELAVSLLTR